MSKNCAITIVARNYLAQAKILARSFLEFNPECNFYTLIIDGTNDNKNQELGVGTVVLPTDLPINPTTWNQMATIYDVMELATAIKPTALTFALADSGGSALYLDPDIEVFDSLISIFDSLDTSSIALTPHAIQPIPRDTMETSEQTLRNAGIFNLGFIGVSPKADQFLTWWHERLRIDAVVDLENALFTDQRWIDFVPSLFDCVVLKDAGLNVAYWNLHERKLSYQNGRNFVDESTLKFFHFSGFDPAIPWLLSKHAGQYPRVVIAESSELRALCEGYAQQLKNNSHEEQKKTPYLLQTTPSGLRLNPTIRKFYRAELKSSLLSGSQLPPNPISDPDDFIHWASTPLFGIPGYKISRIERFIWQSRQDLGAHFPDVEASSSKPFRTWLETEDWAKVTLEQLTQPPSPGNKLLPLQNFGWNMVGYFSAELGVGEAGRRLGKLVEAVGLPVEYVGVNTQTSRENHSINQPIRSEVKFKNSILAVNADQTPRIIEMSGLSRRPRQKRIGFWFWELEEFPKKWMPSFDCLTEIWCASEFIYDSLSAVSPIPVKRIDLPIADPGYRHVCSREQTGLPPGFTFLFTYDFNSILQRKNPADVIDAYTRAFSPSDGTALYLKSINGNNHRSEIAKLKYLTQFRDDIFVVDGYVSPEIAQAQIEHAECFVSLHRSEGLGLNIAAALAAGRPTIATGYSGNMSFTPATYPYLVSFEKINVGPDAGPYNPNAFWAQPDLNCAANHMRHIFDHYSEAHNIGLQTRTALLSRFTVNNALKTIGPMILSY